LNAPPAAKALLKEYAKGRLPERLDACPGLLTADVRLPWKIAGDLNQSMTRTYLRVIAPVFALH
jgi:hypothetical protein